MTDHNAEGRQDGGLNPQALRLEDLARILSASGQRQVTVEMIEADVGEGAPLDGRQREHREGRRGQLETLEEEEHRADRRDRGPDHGPGPCQYPAPARDKAFTRPAACCTSNLGTPAKPFLIRLVLPPSFSGRTAANSSSMVRRKAVGYWDHSTPPPIIQLYIESIGRWHRRFTPVTTERLEINIVGSREPPSALPGHGVRSSGINDRPLCRRPASGCSIHRPGRALRVIGRPWLDGRWMLRGRPVCPLTTRDREPPGLWRPRRCGREGLPIPYKPARVL